MESHLPTPPQPPLSPIGKFKSHISIVWEVSTVYHSEWILSVLLPREQEEH